MLRSILLLALFISCVPSTKDQPQKLERGACLTGSYFDSVSRKCIASMTTITHPPTNTLTTATMFEDNDLTAILTYTDPEGDFATSCNVYDILPPAVLSATSNCQCIGGICSITLHASAEYSGIAQFYYTVTDVDGTSRPSIVKVVIQAVEDPPVAVGPTPNNPTFYENSSQTFTLGYTDAESDKGLGCEITFGGSDYNGTISTPCSCNSYGTCTFTIRGQPEKLPTPVATVRESFSYKIKEKNDLWSNPSSSYFYNIIGVNNLPTPVSATQASSIGEGFATPAITLTYSEADNTKPVECILIQPTGVASPADIPLCDCSGTFGQCTMRLQRSAGVYENSSSMGISFKYAFYDGHGVTMATPAGTIGPVSDRIYLTVVPTNNPIMSTPAIPNKAAVTWTPTPGIEGTPLEIVPTLYVDEGGASDENAQYLRACVSVVPTPQNAVLTYAGITIKYNGTSTTLFNPSSCDVSSSSSWPALDDPSVYGTMSSDTYPISFSVRPEGNRSGCAQIALVITEHNVTYGTPTPIVFTPIPVCFTPVNDPPYFRSRVPNNYYDKYDAALVTNCDNQYSWARKEGCVGAVDPNGVVTPTPGEVYYNYKTGLNYAVPLAGGGWTPFITDCPYGNRDNGTCLEKDYNTYNPPRRNCIGEKDPALVMTPAFEGIYYFDFANNICYRSTGTPSWERVNDPTPTAYCEYDTTCSGSYCYGSTAPTALPTPTADIWKVYKNTSTGSCYVAYVKFTPDNTTLSPTARWDEFSTTCAYSKSACRERLCTSGQSCYLNCIGNFSPRNGNRIIPSAIGKYFYDYQNKVCYKSTGISTGESDVNWVIYGHEIADISGNSATTLTLNNIMFSEGPAGDTIADKLKIKVHLLTNNVTPTAIDYLGGSIGKKGLFEANRIGIDCNGVQITPTPVSASNSNISFVLDGSPPCLGSSADAYKNIKIKFRANSGYWGRTEVKLSLEDVTANPTPIEKYFSLLVYPITSSESSSGIWNEVASVGNKSNRIATSATPAVTDVLENIFVKLTWNSVTLTGSTDSQSPNLSSLRTDYSGASISGYNVYRRMANEEFNFDLPLNTTPISSSSKTFTDIWGKTNDILGPPFPNTVYYYTIRALDSYNKLLVNVGATDLRVIAPPDNMVFVHRSMANKEICTNLHSESDETNNNRCEYKGPGESTTSPGYYDIGYDMLVDRFEAGCPYGDYSGTPSFGDSNDNPARCRGSSSDCYALDANGVFSAHTPVSGISDTAIKGNVFYSRKLGQCFVNIDNTNWKSYDSASPIPTVYYLQSTHTRYPGLPPLVYVSQERANEVCNARSRIQIYTYNIPGVAIATPIASPSKIPSRKEQIAYSAWPSSWSDTNINEIERGLSLNASQKCNSSLADGWSTYFTNSNPGPASLFTMPGSRDCMAGADSTNANKCIRSFTTGSSKTSSASAGSFMGCISRYGVQDFAGNVKEYVDDRIFCQTDYQCIGVYPNYSGLLCRFNTANEVNGLVRPTSGTFDTCTNNGKDGNCLSNIANVSPTEASNSNSIDGLVFYNSYSDKCHISVPRADPSTYAWINLWATSKCPITSSETDTGCSSLSSTSSNSGLNCISYDRGSLVSSNAGSYLYINNGTCYSSSASGIASWTPIASFAVTPPPLNNNSDMKTTDPYFYYWALDGRKGPCNSSVCSYPLESGWYFHDRSNDASYFIFPMGLPAVSFFSSNFSTSGLLSSNDGNGSLLEIGMSGGITQDKLHSDYFKVNMKEINTNDKNHCGAFTTGGGFNSGDQAGRYTIESVPCNANTTTATPTPDSNMGPDVGFRCILRVYESIYKE
ncbi:MAG: hypothetical protein HQK49_14955 [Oligoflexia bacterium]|nr:hypothetical protein [Oligoflexia bacterium]